MGKKPRHLNENEYHVYLGEIQDLIHKIEAHEIPMEEILESTNWVWEGFPNDSEYHAVLEAKTKQVYDTLYNDPLNSIQKYFPYKFEQFDSSSKHWWMSLIHRAQIVKPQISGE